MGRNYRRVSLVFCLGLALVGTLQRKLFGPTPETEPSRLLCTGLGIVCNAVTHPFKNGKLQIVVVILMISAMIVNNALQGSLIENLNVPSVKEIDSLDKLLKTDLEIVTTPFIYNNLQHVTGDVTLQQIKARLKIAPHPGHRKNPTFVQGKTAFLEPKEKAYSMAETIYDDQGNDLIYVVPEQVHTYYVSFAARLDLSIVWKVNKLIAQMSQHGVIQREFALMFRAVELLQIDRARQGMLVNYTLNTIGLEELRQLLSLVVIAYVISIATFALEFVYNLYSAQIRRKSSRFAELCKAKSYEFVWWLIIYIKTV